MYQKTTLDNGVRIITEEMPHLRSACFGILIGVGSRDETLENSGISHFVEHMRFKGTNKKSVKELSEAIDELGGHIDASTSRESTCYYAKVIDAKLPQAINVLSEIFFESTFPDDEIEREKEVVNEEIKMYEDSPDEMIYDLFTQSMWGKHPLGRPIWGNPGVVNSLNRDALFTFCNDYYTPDRIIISATGNVSHEKTVDMLSAFGQIKAKEKQDKGYHQPEVSSNIMVQEKDLEQVHFCLGTTGLPYTHEDRFVLRLLSVIIGGGMSSRLFQNIREKRALAYDVHSYCTAHREAGTFAVYVGTSPEKYSECMEIILKEFGEIRKNGVLTSELEKAKDRMKSILVLHMEDSSYRMSRLAEQEFYFGKHSPIDDLLLRIDKVTMDDIRRLASLLLDEKYFNLAAIGPVKKKECERLMSHGVR
ncbi:insulinase family protein [Candidatus Desantisbacteria bacterium]|nr:insulinase family protein [Candidatus Desantisbacteria bacterium]